MVNILRFSCRHLMKVLNTWHTRLQGENNWELKEGVGTTQGNKGRENSKWLSMLFKHPTVGYDHDSKPVVTLPNHSSAHMWDLTAVQCHTAETAQRESKVKLQSERPQETCFKKNKNKSLCLKMIMGKCHLWMTPWLTRGRGGHHHTAPHPNLFPLDAPRLRKASLL